MSDIIIRAEGLGKSYRLHHQRQEGYVSLRDVLTETTRAIGQRLSGRGNQAMPEDDEEFWALRDISFEIRQGEVLGIIGRNGAGKSTLLKILSRITEPTEGRVRIRGRVASLLEVGTGFHPELSGRENIYLNGAILGMTRAEVRRKFDDIVAFAEVAKFLDTPVKRYSSGMYVRLAFAVAAHLEPEILVVDEVLAVGDAAFQKKCLGKMGDVARDGRTVLFVSHNLGAVRNLCRLVLLIDNGMLKFHGMTEEGLAIYENGFSGAGDILANTHFQGHLSDQIRFNKLVYYQGGKVVTVLDPLQDFEIELQGLALRTFPTLELKIGLFRDGLHITSCYDTEQVSVMRQGVFISRFHIPPRVMRPGRYTIGVGAVDSIGLWTWGSDVATLDFLENWGGQSAERNRGVVNLPYTAERIQSENMPLSSGDIVESDIACVSGTNDMHKNIKKNIS